MLERHHKLRKVSLPLGSLLLTYVWMAYAVRVLALDVQGLWRDEVDVLRFATAPWSEVLRNFTRPGWNGPLYFFLQRGWIALAGESAFALRYFPLLCGVLGIALFYVLGKRVVGGEAVFWSLPPAVFSPYLNWYAQDAKMYTWVPALVLLALYALVRACEHAVKFSGWWFVVLGATSLAVYSHILAALLIPVEVLWFLLQPRRHAQAWRGGLMTLALLTLPYLPLLHWQAPLIFQARETGFPVYTLWQMSGTLLVGWSAGIYAWGQRAATLVLGALALLGLGGCLIHREARTALRLLGWTLFPLLAIWFVSRWQSLFTDRYLIWALPAFYFAVGLGLYWLYRLGSALPLLPLLAILVLDGGNLYAQARYPIKPQFREAAVELCAQRRADELLLFQIPYNHIMVEYYCEVPLDPWAEAPYTNWRTPEGGYLRDAVAVAVEMGDLTRDYERVWLVYSEVPMWDDRELVRQWLDAHGELLSEHRYHAVDLYQYALLE